VRGSLVLDAFDELDAVVDEVRVEVLDLLLRQVDLVEARDDPARSRAPRLNGTSAADSTTLVEKGKRRPGQA
jgi:hypothetical protein